MIESITKWNWLWAITELFQGPFTTGNIFLRTAKLARYLTEFVWYVNGLQLFELNLIVERCGSVVAC